MIHNNVCVCACLLVYDVCARMLTLVIAVSVVMVHTLSRCFMLYDLCVDVHNYIIAV